MSAINIQSKDPTIRTSLVARKAERNASSNRESRKLNYDSGNINFLIIPFYFRGKKIFSIILFKHFISVCGFQMMIICVSFKPSKTKKLN
jgi:hypothetical protein